MALVDVIREVLADLRTIPGILQAPDAPPDHLGEFPILIAYPQPDASAHEAHDDGNGRGVYRSEDTIVVEWHTQEADIARAVEVTTPMVDAIRREIFSGFRRDKFNGSVVRMRAVRVQTYGELGWGSDRTFGVRVLIDVTHHDLTS